MVLAHARASHLSEINAAADWKREKKTSGRRKSSASSRVTPDVVLTGEELRQLLDTRERGFPESYGFVLFPADTGARFGEATALRWSDIDPQAGTARIARSFSSGKYLGPTKAEIERNVELSSRLRASLDPLRSFEP